MEGESLNERQKRKLEKMERKKQRLEERLARKEMKLEERLARKEAKKKQDEIKFGLVKLPQKDSWPKEGSTLFLDGNNMLYVLSVVRGMVLKRNTTQAEHMLELIAREFAQKANLDKCVLIFDDTQTRIVEDRFEVCSARPSFNTSDDALVHWCQNREPAVYVTSDRELIQRLTDNKGLVCKPKEWFVYAAKLIEGDESKVSSLDEWAKLFFAKHNIECY